MELPYYLPAANHFILREDERARIESFLATPRILTGVWLSRDRVPNWRVLRRYSRESKSYALLRHAREALLELELDAKGTVVTWTLFEAYEAARKWANDGLYFDPAVKDALSNAFPSDESPEDVLFRVAGSRPFHQREAEDGISYFVADRGFVTVRADGSARVVEGEAAWRLLYG